MHTSGWVWHHEVDDAPVGDDSARIRAVLGHCPTGIAVLDKDGNLSGYNEEFRSLFSKPPLLGEPVGQLFDAGERRMFEEVVALAGTKQRAGAIISMQPPSGEEHSIEFLIGTLPGDASCSIGVVMAANDRTERIREDRDRSLLAREIGNADCQRAISLSQAALCHDLNNVLAVFTITLGLLRKRCRAEDPQTGALLRELEDAATHGSEIVARAKRPPPESVVSRREIAEVRRCVERAAQVVAPLACSAKATLATHVLADARVSLSGTELTQVLTNLLTNSVHAIQDAGRPGRVDLTVERAAPEAVTLTVRDNGIGIEPSRLVDSFEAFQTTRAERGGTGLGLAIAREIVEGVGGHIDVLSTPGSATEMRITLPVVIADEPSQASSAAREEKAAFPSGG